MRKIFSYFALLIFVGFGLCNASTQARDLLIYFDVDEQPKARFYKHVMQDSVGLSSNRKADPYHVTLLIVADVNEKDYLELASRLKNTVNKNKLTSSFSFTAHKASLLSNGNVGNSNQGTVILEPLSQEKISFQLLNRQLVDVLARYNGEKAVSYGIRPETNPSEYNPHLSIAKKEVFDKHLFLNRQRVVQTVNQALSEARNREIEKMLSPKPQVKDLWAAFKGASRTVPVKAVNPLPAPKPTTTPKPVPIVKKKVVRKSAPVIAKKPVVARKPAPIVKRRAAGKKPTFSRRKGR